MQDNFWEKMRQEAQEYVNQARESFDRMTAFHDEMHAKLVEHLEPQDVALLNQWTDSNRGCFSDGQANLDQQLTELYGPYSEADKLV